MPQSTEPSTAKCEDQKDKIIAQETLSPSEPTTQITDERPQINSLDDLLDRGEATITRRNSNGDCTVIREHCVCFIDDNDVAYYGQPSDSNSSLEDLRECLRRVPDSEVFPKPPFNTTICSQVPATEDKDLHIKRPDVLSWNNSRGTDYTAQDLLLEVEIYELLRQYPHPNIVQYHGCKVTRGLITGIVLDRHPRTLGEGLGKGPCSWDGDSIFKDIESAVKHLHSLGLAHNDLNPNNIMLNNHGRAFLLISALVSLCPFEMRLTASGGTRGWVEDEDQKCDNFAMAKIRIWLEEKTART